MHTHCPTLAAQYAAATDPARESETAERAG